MALMRRYQHGQKQMDYSSKENHYVVQVAYGLFAIVQDGRQRFGEKEAQNLDMFHSLGQTIKQKKIRE